MAKKPQKSRAKTASLFAPSLFDNDPDAFTADDASNFEVNLPAAESAQPKTSAPAAEPDPIATPSAIIHHSTFRFISFGSGSSGNCAYIGTDTEGVIIDAGVEDKKVYSTLASHGITPEMIKGVCLTHDHGDHVRYAYTLVRRHRHMGVYCTPRVLQGIFRRHSISRSLRERHVPVFKEIPFKVGTLTITPFEVAHDGSDNAGFFIEAGDLKFVVATDIGSITPRARHYLSQANFLMLESNYDPAMLESGTYPEYLKSRIRGANGHLENETGARFVAEIFSPRLRYVFLCHLSKDNNTPELALETYRRILTGEHGISLGTGEETVEDMNANLQLVVLPRYDATRFYTLR